MEKVVDELMGMYHEADAPLTTIHVGGDEVPAGAWEGSTECKKLIGAPMNNETPVNEINDLWYYYLDKIHRMLADKGIQLSGWEEVGMRKTMLDGKHTLIPNGQFADKNIQLHVWLNMPGWGAEDLPFKLANLGYKVVLSPVSNNYFDLAYYKSPDEPGYYWGGFEDLDKPFYFVPFDNYKTSKEDAEGHPIDPAIFKNKERLTDYGKTNIVGIQGLLWSENLRSMDQVYYMLLPKLLALAERAWSQDPEWANAVDSSTGAALYNQSWSAFVNTVGKRELPRLNHFAGGFHYRIPTVGAIQKQGNILLNLQLPGLAIRYTTDGSEPTINSKKTSAIITEKGVIKIRVFDSIGRGSRTTTIENK
jgi:hexosaminidase